MEYKEERECCYCLEEVSLVYPSGFELNIPHISIYNGDSIGFYGSNGSGKSTLLKICAFLMPPHGGSLTFNGKRVHDRSEFQRDVTYLMQDPYLLKRSVFENIAYGLRKRKDTENLKERVFHAMELVALDPARFSTRKWHELSGGEVQRVALAARLILRPRVLILDEPVSSNDVASARHIREAILSLRKEYTFTLLATSHDMVWLSSVTDRIFRIHDGRIIGSGVENVLYGPWKRDHGDIWSMNLTGKVKIFATQPPHPSSPGILEPDDIVLASTYPEGLSAQNILAGKIISLTEEDEGGKVTVTVALNGIEISCHVTHETLLSMKLLPGREIFLVFKASSIRWG